jgi:hypothetical protein
MEFTARHTHFPGLFKSPLFYWLGVVRPGGFELPAFWFVARRSIQLSYGRTVFFPYHYKQLTQNFQRHEFRCNSVHSVQLNEFEPEVQTQSPFVLRPFCGTSHRL